MKFFKPQASYNQKGTASIVVTLVLVALLSSIGVAFAVLMNRELNKSLANQLGQVAYDAAESGINDVISYVRDNPNTNATDCQALLRSGAPLSQAYQLSASTKYTCALLNTQPTSLAYQSILADHSQVVRVTTSAPASKAMISWQATNRTYNKFIASSGSACNNIGTLYDESKWNGCSTAPMLRVTLYPIPADTLALDSAAADSRTYFLYPATTNSSTVDQLSYNTQTGSLVPVSCGTQATNNTFSGSADYDCNVIITNLPAGSNASGNLYYIRFTPIYSSADVILKANSASGQSLKFLYTQAVVDVTAQASSAVKRLQARVDISSLYGTSQDITSSSDGLPEYAVQSADAICKRIQVSNHADFPAYIDDNSRPYCGNVSNLPPLTPPIVSVDDCHSTDYTTAHCSGTVNPNNGQVSACSWSLSDGQGKGCATTPTHSTTPYTVNWDISGLTAGSSYTATLCASNQAGQRCSSSSGFSTPSPPPPPPPAGGQTVTVHLGWDVTIDGDGPGLNNCDFFNGGNSSAPGNWVASWYPVDVNYAPTHTYGSANYSPPASTKLIHCKGISGADGWSDSPPPPATYVNINFFVVQGPYHNPNASQRFCPDDVHHYQVCMNWAVTTNYNGGIQCKAFWNGPNGPSNSGYILSVSIGSSSGGNGATFGSDDSSFLYNQFTGQGGSGSLQCQGIGGSGPSASVSNGSPPAQSKSGNYWYTTINCLNSQTHQEGGFCEAN